MSIASDNERTKEIVDVASATAKQKANVDWETMARNFRESYPHNLCRWPKQSGAADVRCPLCKAFDAAQSKIDILMRDIAMEMAQADSVRCERCI